MVSFVTGPGYIDLDPDPISIELASIGVMPQLWAQMSDRRQSGLLRPAEHLAPITRTVIATWSDKGARRAVRGPSPSVAVLGARAPPPAPTEAPGRVRGHTIVVDSTGTTNKKEPAPGNWGRFSRRAARHSNHHGIDHHGQRRLPRRSGGLAVPVATSPSPPLAVVRVEPTGNLVPQQLRPDPFLIGVTMSGPPAVAARDVKTVEPHQGRVNLHRSATQVPGDVLAIAHHSVSLHPLDQLQAVRSRYGLDRPAVLANEGLDHRVMVVAGTSSSPGRAA